MGERDKWRDAKNFLKEKMVKSGQSEEQAEKNARKAAETAQRNEESRK